MDYSQVKQPSNDVQDFFTTGAGTNDESLNNFQAEDNLDLGNSAANWGTAPAEHDQQKIGSEAIGAAINAAATPINSATNSIDTPPMPPAELEQPSIPELGKVTSLEVVPSQPSEEQNLNTEATEGANTPSLKFVETKESLNKEGVVALNQSVAKFNADGDAAGFYKEIRDAMENNLDNSYNRKLAA